ncbi:hypothetical protein Pelo_24 [Pelomyxa schiedti]|nr:hypothetical protein Pelo_24 [Pelomyxa schiedti]
MKEARIVGLVVVVLGLAVGGVFGQWCDQPSPKHSWSYISSYYYFSENDYISNTSSTYTGQCTTYSYRDAWYSFVPSVDGVLLTTTCGTTWDTVIEVQGGSSCSTRSCIDTDDDGCNWPSSSVSVNVNAYYIYNIRIRPFSSTTSSISQYTFTLQFTPSTISSTQSEETFCPVMNYLYDYTIETHYLSSWDEVDTGDCWDDSWYWEYGMWFTYTPYVYMDPCLTICGDSPFTLEFVDDLCDYWGATPSCTYSASSYWTGDYECYYRTVTHLDGYYGYSIDFLVKSEYSYAEITLDTCPEDYWSSDDFHFPLWVVITTFVLLFLCVVLLVVITVYCCHKRTVNKKKTYDHLDDQKDLVEIPSVSINGPPTLTPVSTPMPPTLIPPVQPANMIAVTPQNAAMMISPPNVPPPTFTPVYMPYTFMQPVAPPPQPPPQLYPTAIVPPSAPMPALPATPTSTN